MTVETRFQAPATSESEAPLIDLSAVAAEPPAESIAHENEIVEHIALEDGDPDHPDPEVLAQLQALVDPDEIRKH